MRTHVSHFEPLEDRRLLTADVVAETGDLVAEMQRWKELAFGRDSQAYVAPSGVERGEFELLAATLLDGDLEAAADLADALDYELVEFTDAVSQNTFFELREELVEGSPTRGWGTYIVNLSFEQDGLVEVPHPLFDTNSWDIGAKFFRDSGARGLLMAGAHRHANGTGTADVAHLEESVFQTVHQVWNGPDGATTAWQVHGFALSKHDGDPGEDHFPAGTDLVISNGDGGVSPEVLAIDDRFEEHEFHGYSYNTLPPSHPVNVTVNDGIDGTTFSSLAATTNVQGNYSRGLGGQFVHVEFEQSIRFDATNRDLAATLLVEAFSSQATPDLPSTKFYVADTASDATFEYSANGELLEEYALDSDNTMPRGAATDATGEVVWVLDNDDHVYVYDHAGQVIGQWKAQGMSLPEGIASDGENIWIVDRGTDRVSFFADAASIRQGARAATSSFPLDSGNRNPRGITTDGSHFWVVNWASSNDKVFKYTIDGDLQGSWNIDTRNANPRGITIDPANPRNIWIVDNGTDAIYQYLGGGDRISASQSADAVFQLAAANGNPQGLADPPAPVRPVSARQTPQAYPSLDRSVAATPSSTMGDSHRAEIASLLKVMRRDTLVRHWRASWPMADQSRTESALLTDASWNDAETMATDGLFADFEAGWPALPSVGQ